MNRPKIAIVGTGIAGLACAWRLHQHFQVTLLEKDTHIGGHTNTVTVEEDGKELPIDTGFMVFNEVTYPNLVRFFDELGVESKNTDMSFSVQDLKTGTEFCGSSINHLFAQRRNLFRPRFWKMLMQINRFNDEALRALESGAAGEMSLDEYVRQRGYGQDFFDLYLVPMSSAVWSTPPSKMLKFPASTLLRFFHNHGFLGLNTQHQWRTVVGGSKTYVEKLLSRIPVEVRRETPALSINRSDQGVTVTPSGGEQRFDAAIIATHGDQALELLSDPDELEKETLSCFKYQPNVAQLHTDASVMPKTRLAWSSWNYRMPDRMRNDQTCSTVYWMNCLQGVSDTTDYFVSINGQDEIDPDKVLKTIHYEHPLFDCEAIEAQKRLPTLNSLERNTHTYFCGSYFRYGFHEDAFISGEKLCADLIAGLEEGRAA